MAERSAPATRSKETERWTITASSGDKRATVELHLRDQNLGRLVNWLGEDKVLGFAVDAILEKAALTIRNALKKGASEADIATLMAEWSPIKPVVEKPKETPKILLKAMGHFDKLDAEGKAKYLADLQARA